MEQNQPTVDNDLQKAIDNITNTTNIDPVFSDPVAAPSSVPEGDTGELSEPVGPFPAPEPEPAPAPEPPAPALAPEPPAPAPEAPAPLEQPVAPMPEPIINPEITIETPSSSLSMHQVKEAALRDLMPLIDRLNVSASQKFNLYKDIFENMRDYTVLAPAYQSAKEITDDTERAEALLYLIESIDKM